MFKDDIFDEWLDSESRVVLDKFKKNEHLTVEDKMVLTLKAQTNHFAHLDIELREELEKSRKISSDELKTFREDQNRKWEDQNKKWDEMNKKWDEVNKNIQKIYESINNQTWKMIGAIGLIVILGRIIDTFGK